MPKAASDHNNSRPRQRTTRDYDPATAANAISQQWQTVLHTVVIPICQLAPGEYEREYQPRMDAGQLVCPICDVGPLTLASENTHCRHERTNIHLRALEKRTKLRRNTLVDAVRESDLRPLCLVCGKKYARQDSFTRHLPGCGLRTEAKAKAKAAQTRARCAVGNRCMTNESFAPHARQRPAPYPRPAHPRTQTAPRYVPIAPLPAPGPSAIGARSNLRAESWHPAAPCSAPALGESAPRTQAPRTQAPRTQAPRTPRTMHGPLPPPADPRWTHELPAAPGAQHAVWPSAVPLGFAAPVPQAFAWGCGGFDGGFDPALVDVDALAVSAAADIGRFGMYDVV
ncbi:hypothetical protein PsYK624_083030 [Phanerochaete sordida]|uniref:Uncharacterized protein n=1 Tax=Phanerochaete sordida TaxID=48140 RepID=A0A9P3GCH3_9APHY|nr:hypothetical protein PsYK624_083030 [Phanerochaete sordida]